MSTDLKYQAVLDYLYSFVDYSLTHQQNLAPENFDLARMRDLMESLGNPQDTYPCIHVAGSKGKGSVSAFCAAALQAEGYKVGLNTSPHLKDFEERIQVNGKPISQDELVSLIDEIKPFVAAIPRLTTFEISTALAFWYFAKQSVDIAVIEVGLGGRLDATNVITPLVAVITSLFLEHTSILGETLPKIAAEKGGIIKPGVPVVLAQQQASAREVIAKIAAEKGAPLVQIGIDYVYEPGPASLDGQQFRIWQKDKNQPDQVNIPLLGPHQVENAAVAYAALHQLDKSEFSVRRESIWKGFASTKWPGRFEILRRTPPVVADSAHTPDAVEKLLETIDQFFPDLPMVLVFGASEDKNIRGMLSLLAPRAEWIICTKSTHPRAMSPKDLQEQAVSFNHAVKTIDNPGNALAESLQLAGSSGLVLITGSIFIVASARIAWFERHFQ